MSCLIFDIEYVCMECEKLKGLKMNDSEIVDFWTWLESCPVPYEIDDLQGFDGVSIAFYPRRG